MKFNNKIAQIKGDFEYFLNHEGFVIYLTNPSYYQDFDKENFINNIFAINIDKSKRFTMFHDIGCFIIMVKQIDRWRHLIDKKRLGKILVSSNFFIKSKGLCNEEKDRLSKFYIQKYIYNLGIKKYIKEIISVMYQDTDIDTILRDYLYKKDAERNPQPFTYLHGNK